MTLPERAPLLSPTSGEEVAPIERTEEYRRMKESLDSMVLQSRIARIVDHLYAQGMSRDEVNKFMDHPTEDNPILKRRLDIIASRLQAKDMNGEEIEEFIYRSTFRYHEKRAAEAEGQK